VQRDIFLIFFFGSFNSGLGSAFFTTTSAQEIRLKRLLVIVGGQGRKQSVVVGDFVFLATTAAHDITSPEGPDD
jgi:hypothetical protein